jgi:phage terminase large subunit GpA-like protein
MIPIRPNEIQIEFLDLAPGENAFLAEMARLLATALRPPPRISPTEWIADKIELSKQETNRPGKLRLLGYQRPVADDFADPAVDQITVLKGARVGWSQVSGAVLCYVLAHERSKCIYAQPTDDDAKGFYKDVIEPRFRDVAAMSAIIRSPGSGESKDTWSEHRYSNGAVLYMRGAASDDSFRRISSRVNVGDEVDAEGWQSKESSSQGDKFELFRTRGADFWDSKLCVGSTPLLRETSRIWREWLLSDQRKFHVTCPFCRHQQELRWGGKNTRYGFKWSVSAAGILDDVWYQCDSEKVCRISEEYKEALIEGGEYIPTAIPNRPGHRGYHWPQWLSMSPKASWFHIVEQWLTAQGDTEKLRVFVNNVLGEPWDDLQDAGTVAERLPSQIRLYPAEVPDDVVLLTAGIDTQTNKQGKGFDVEIASREISIVGWNRHEVPRVIGHWVVEGEPGDPAADAELDRIMQREFTNGRGQRFRVVASAIDMGGHFGDQVRLYAAARLPWRVWAIKGRSIALGSRSSSIWPRKASTNKEKRFQWFMVDTQLAKDVVSRKLALKGISGPHFPTSLPQSYFDGLSAETIVEKKGKRSWQRKKRSETGESWDCLVYAYAALCGVRQSLAAYRDLTKAAERLTILDIRDHDQETGEIIDVDYLGEDRSAMSTSLSKDQVTLSKQDVAQPVAAAHTTPLPSFPTAPAPSSTRPAPHPAVSRKRVAKVLRPHW